MREPRSDQFAETEEEIQREDAPENPKTADESPAAGEGSGDSFAEVRNRDRKSRGDESRSRRHVRLSFGDYIVPESTQNMEAEGARREFMKAVGVRVPRFAIELRERVYPEYAEMIGKAVEGSESVSIAGNQGVVADPQPVPGLMKWAKAFYVAGEGWILEGALQTLARWRRNPEARDSLDLRGLATSLAVDTLSEGKDALFLFEHPGWDPQFERWSDFRKAAFAKFEERLQAYEEQQRSLMESQGAVRARRRYSAQNLEWLALYQLAGRSTVQILEDYPNLGFGTREK